MARYRLDILESLARQMSFTPVDIRKAQLDAAETLLLELDASKAYPVDFVIFRITGYRGKSASDQQLLTGLALQHDLGLLIEQVSDTLEQRTDRLEQPVLQIEDVCARFNVTSKTIQRWRRRGLASRRFIFADGKRRVGFLLSSVERFLAAHGQQVARGANFSQVGQAEREQIIRRARRLASGCRCCVNEITRRLARRMNRSPLTILHTLRKHDQENPAEAVFPLAADPIEDAARLRIIKAYRAGRPLSELARRMCKPRSAIYRVIVDERASRLARRKIKFIDDPLFHQPDAEQVLDALCRQPVLDTSTDSTETRVPRDLPPYLQSLYRTPLLSAAMERALFLRFNFAKFQFAQARHRLEPTLARARELDRLEDLLAQVAQVKNQIVSANLRLVVSVARKHLRPGSDLMELVSEGNLTLMRAVESFDVNKGNRFSTYATLALMRGFARSVPAMRTRGGVETEILDSIPDRRAVTTDRIDQIDQVQTLLARLTRSEREVLEAHFGVCRGRGGSGDSVGPIPLGALADRLGLSLHRLRRIEQAAMQKLRRLAGQPA